MEERLFFTERDPHGEKTNSKAAVQGGQLIAVRETETTISPKGPVSAERNTPRSAHGATVHAAVFPREEARDKTETREEAGPKPKSAQSDPMPIHQNPIRSNT